MNINDLLLGGLIGAFFSWLITHIYYKISSRDQRLLFSKLSQEIRETILTSPEEMLSGEKLKMRLEHLEKGSIDANRLTGAIDAGTF